MATLQIAHTLIGEVMRNTPGALERLRAHVPALKALVTAGGADAREAAYMLGGAYMNAFGDDATAVTWFERAGEHAGSLRTLGFLMENGRGAAPDPVRAAQLYERAATLGDVVAQFNLGICSRDGLGRTADRAAAIHWFRAAAEQGKVTAMLALGKLLVEVNQGAEALRWYLRAAEAGNPGAMRAAADSYRDGQGIPRDLVQAVRWYFRMLATGNGDGIHEIHRLMPDLTDTQVLQAAELAGDRGYGQTAIESWR